MLKFITPCIRKFNEHCYWTGLLFLARVVLYLVFVFSNPSLNLLVTIAVTCGLLFLEGHFGRIYEEKSRIFDTIEMINCLNIDLFSAATLFTTQAREYQSKVSFTSVSVAFAFVSFHVSLPHLYRTPF